MKKDTIVQSFLENHPSHQSFFWFFYFGGFYKRVVLLGTLVRCYKTNSCCSILHKTWNGFEFSYWMRWFDCTIPNDVSPIDNFQRICVEIICVRRQLTPSNNSRAIQRQPIFIGVIAYPRESKFICQHNLWLQWAVFNHNIRILMHCSYLTLFDRCNNTYSNNVEHKAVHIFESSKLMWFHVWMTSI